jgi:DNA-binding GntR family transcriptional regulator
MTGALSPHQIHHSSIADATAVALRRMILMGELAGGTKVTQESLSQLLGVSTMPIREALLRLRSEGLIESAPKRYFRVVTLTQRDVRDVYWVQAVMSGELTRRACEHATPALLTELHELQAKFDVAHDGGDSAAMEESNWRFHRKLHHAADSSRLTISLASSLRYVPAGLYPHVAAWRAETARGHRLILDALDRGDSDAAGAEATRHVIAAGELLVTEFFDRGYWGVPDSSAERPD